MSFLPDIDLGSWADFQKKELDRQLNEKIGGFNLEQAINEKMSGLQEVVGGAQEALGGAATAAGTALGGGTATAAVAPPANNDQMRQVQEAMARTQPALDQAAPAPVATAVAEPPPAAMGFGPDQQRQIEEQLRRTAPDLSQAPAAESASAEPDRMRQIQDMLSQTGRAVSQQLASSPGEPLPSRGGAPSAEGGVNPNPTPTEVRAYITDAARARGIDPNIALKVANSEGGFEAARRGTFKTGSSWWPFQLHYGGPGYEQLGNVAGMGNSFTRETGYQPGDPNAWQAATDYALDRAKTGGWGAWYGAKAQGIEGFQGIDKNAPGLAGRISEGVRSATRPFVEGGQAVVNAVRGGVSQFGSNELSSDEAYAACGPAAAVSFAQRFGRNPSLREATDLAKSVGWTSSGGMAGIGSQQALMNKLGVETQLIPGAQWDKFAAEASTGNPVTISTSAHYFYADDYDPRTGAFHVGRSGTDLRGGKEWMTQGEIQAAAERLGGGNVQGALFANNPTVSTETTAQPGQTMASVERATQGESLLDQLMRGSQEASERGRSWLDEQTRNMEAAVLQAGEVGQAERAQRGDSQRILNESAIGREERAAERGLTTPEGIGRAILQSPLTPWGAAEAMKQVGTSGVGEFYKSLPTPVESVETMVQLAEKYPSRVPGLPDMDAMTPEDRALYNENSLNVGAMSEPVVNRMGAGAQRLRAAAQGSGLERELASQQMGITDLLRQLDAMDERLARVTGGGEPAAPVSLEERIARVASGEAPEAALGSAQPSLLPETAFQPGLPMQDISGQVRATPQELALLEAAGKTLDDLPLLRAGRELPPVNPSAAENAPFPEAIQGGQPGLLPETEFQPGLPVQEAPGQLRATPEELERLAAAGRSLDYLPLLRAGRDLGPPTGAGGPPEPPPRRSRFPEVGEGIPRQEDLLDADLKAPAKPGAWDYALSGQYFSLLSAVPTHVRNVISGILTTGALPAESAGAAAFDPLSRRIIRGIDKGAKEGQYAQRERFFGEAGADIFGAATALPLGLRKAVKAYVTEADAAAVAADRARPEVFRSVPVVGDVINAPGRALRAEDAFFSTLNEQAAAYRMAYRQVQQEGVKGTQAQAKRIVDIVREPSEDFLKEVQRQGKYRTFQQEGGISDWLIQKRNDHPWTKFLVPFVKTPINLSKYILERSPLAGFGIVTDILREGRGATELNPRGRSVLRDKPGGAAGDLSDRMSRATMGTVAMGGLYALAETGNLTGAAPADPADRDAFYRQGKQPYSFKNPVTGDWISYKAMSPFTPWLATAANVSQRLKDNPDADVQGLLLLAGVTFGQGMLDTQWTEGFTDVLEIFSGEGQMAVDPTTKAKQVIERYAGSRVPAFVRTLARAHDNTIRDPDGPIEAMMANVPGLSGQVKPKLDAFGNERKYANEGAEALWNVFESTTPTQDPVEIELKRLQTDAEGHPRYDVQPGFVSDRMTAFGQQVELDPAQEQWYQQQSGSLSYAVLHAVVGSNEWKAMNDSEKADAVDRIVSRSREAMRTQLESTLFPQALEGMVKEQRKLGEGPTPEPTPTSTPTPALSGTPGVYESRPIRPTQEGVPTYESRPIR